MFTALAGDLAQSENRKGLADRALQTPLHFLASFLGYAAKTAELKSVFTALAGDLAQSENRKALADRALKTPLDSLANFLGYAAKTTELKPVFTALAEDLARPENRRHLTTALEGQPLDAVVSVMKSDVASDLWTAVFANVDAAGWEEARRAEELPQINAFVAFQRIATQKGRPELAEAPALRVVLGSTRDHWHQPVIALHHLAHVLRLARAATPDQIEGFLDRMATAQWVDERLESVSAGGLAGSLLGLATTLEPDRRRWFVRESLPERVGRELSRLGIYDSEFRAQALSLLGAAAAIGVSMPAMHVDWPDTSELAEVLELRLPDPAHATIGHLQVQLWLGLREMARLRADLVTVSQRLADRILDLWMATHDGETGKALPPHVRDLNAEMIAWLRQCKANGWRLIPPQSGRPLSQKRLK